MNRRPQRLPFPLVAVVAAPLVWLNVAAQEHSLESVLARSAEYYLRVHTQVAGIVTEESYLQEARNSIQRPLSQPAARRALRSDLLLVKSTGSRYVEYRDVFEVDGAPVRDRAERLTKLFLKPTATDQRQLKSIIEESARHNIGRIPRNINTPLLTLSFLLPDMQPRFRFRRSRVAAAGLSDRQFAGSSKPGLFRTSAEAWTIEFQETRRPTVIRTNAGRDFPAAGRFWIDPVNGAVLTSELEMDNAEVRGTINVSYRFDESLGFLVPVEMRERYAASGALIEGNATYTNFRRFLVTTHETIGKPPK